MEVLNKNITHNNIEKIKKSMKRLKDTINRSNSNNYRNMKIRQIIHNNEKEYIIKDYYKNDSKSLLYYNINDPLDKENKIYDYHKLDKIKKSPSIHNNNTEFNIINKKIIDKSFNDQNISNFNYILTHNNDNNNIYSPFILSRNKFSINFDSKTDILMNKLDNNNLNTPKLTEFSPDLLKKEHSIILNKINNYSNNTNYQQIIRNRSAKQMKIMNNLINSKNNNNTQKINNNFNSINDYDNMSFNKNIFTLHNFKNKDEYEKYLNNLIYRYNDINKELLLRYKKSINNFKSANDQNNKLMVKIKELRRKEQNIKNANNVLEKEYDNFKNDLSIKNKDNNELKKNEELKKKIIKYDEIIIKLKNEINQLVNQNENDKDYDEHSAEEEANDNIINELEKKIENSYKELNEQERTMKINKQECEKLLNVGEELDIQNNIIQNSNDNEIKKDKNMDNNEYIKYINKLKKEIDKINNQIKMIDRDNNNKWKIINIYNIA